MVLRPWVTLLAVTLSVAGAHAEDDAPPAVSVQVVSSGRQASVYRRVRLDTGWRMFRPYHQILRDGWSERGIVLPAPAWESGPYEAASYEPLCSTPCRVDLAVGGYHLALSQDGGEPVEAPSAVEIQEASRIETTYTSHRTLRLAGWITAGVGVATGAVFVGAGLYQSLGCDVKDGDCELRVRNRFLAGAAFALVSGTIGFGLAHIGDDVSIRVVPSGVDVAARF